VLSYAYGLAAARDAGQSADRRHIVAVIGDGSMTGGMAYEALNNLGHSGKRVIVVLNDIRPQLRANSVKPQPRRIVQHPHRHSFEPCVCAPPKKD